MSRTTGEKNNLRNDMLARRRELTTTQMAQADEAIFLALVEFLDRLPRKSSQRRIAAHQPFGTEPGATLRPRLPQRLESAGWEVLLPITLADNDLDWRRIDSDAPLGVGAITGCLAVIVPALAASASGMRLGRGGGSYDRALARVDTAPIVALLHDTDFPVEVPSLPHDRAVTAVITPSGGISPCPSA
ncbi:5-formyltetrahydrofolate cyclo-ligase [Natronoglycomyces albus]|uniref:5-formyltetrahydrofolate cyclo-ligase n=1 Tax=Natronoglycomyces albus TaxID=2811108 RepID=A0A895XMR2_9ACTN|nr:5-formyltetrahydrofolate cyclo-ligase [Natronoglycomyces albus]QSB04689.1 5-formyltetrahydrofolate cyclo-ligase [Natronoglycomyces albus]